MVTFSVQSNIGEFKRHVMAVDQKQIPFATALALTRTAQGGRNQVQKLLPRLLDRPTRFTKRGVTIERATKRRLVSAVFFKDIQSAYMHWQVDGGTRYPVRRAIPVPVGVRLNKFGNMSRRKVQQLLGKPNVFSGVVKNVPGLWERRRGGRVKLLVAYEPQAKYRKRFPFYKIVGRTVARTFDRELEKAFREAVDGAR